MNDRPVHEAHKAAFLQAISEALGLANQPDVVRKIVSLLIASGTTYEELSALPERAVTRTLYRVSDASNVEIPETRVEYLLNLLPVLTSTVRVCGTCHTVDLKPKAGKWLKVEGGSCPRCGTGIYEAVAFDRGPVSWVNGRVYDPGTEVDENRIPLTDDGILSHMDSHGTPIDTEILRAIGEPATNVPLTVLCGAINRKTNSPVDTLQKLRDYRTLAVDPTALRLYLRDILQTQGKAVVVNEKKETVQVSNTFVRGSKPVEPRLFRKAFENALSDVYFEVADIQRIARHFGVLGRVSFSDGARDIWFNFVSKIDSMGRTTELLDYVYAEYPEIFGPILETYLDERELQRKFLDLPPTQMAEVALAAGLMDFMVSGPYASPLSWYGWIKQHKSVLKLYHLINS